MLSLGQSLLLALGLAWGGLSLSDLTLGLGLVPDLGLVRALGLQSAHAQSVPGGARSVKILFNSDYFSSVPANGSSMTSDLSGVSANTFFTTEATPQTLTKPSWLTAVRVSVGGSQNTSARKGACGGFSPTSGSTSCSFPSVNGPSVNTFSCRGPQKLYRVSEYDCADISGGGVDSAVPGTGAMTDGVSIKIILNRDPSQLGSSENLMLVLEYQASGLAAATQAGSCVDTQGNPLLNHPDCVDQAYQLFARPFGINTGILRLLTVVPPAGGRVNAAEQSFGGPIQTRQMIVPLSTLSPSVNVLQLTRTFGLQDGSRRGFSATCHQDSPLCLGMIFHSLSIFRM